MPKLWRFDFLCVWIEMRRIFFFENLKSQNWVLWINQSCKQLSPRQEQRADGCYRSCSSQTPWEAFLRMLTMAKQYYDTFARLTIGPGKYKINGQYCVQSSWELGSLVFRTWTSHHLMQHFRFKESIGRQQSHHNRHSALYWGVGTAGSLRTLFAASATLDIFDYG